VSFRSWHLNLVLPRGVGQDRLAQGDVADLPARTTRRRVVLLMTEVLGHLLLQRRLLHRGGDRPEQPVRAGQVLTLVTSGSDQLPHRGPLHLTRLDSLPRILGIDVMPFSVSLISDQLPRRPTSAT